jgi:hypothetical protein
LKSVADFKFRAYIYITIKTNNAMKIQVNIFKKGTTEQIGSFITSAKNIQKAFYTHVTFPKYGVCATECYYRLSDI